MLQYARDLKCIILRNKTVDDFIISDNPAAVSNRFAFERGNANFGIIHSGIFLTLPLSPRLSVLFFDIGIYTVSIPRGTRFVDVTKSADVAALNQLQCLSANSNLYFSGWDQADAVTAQAKLAAKSRSSRIHKVTTLVRDHSLPGEAYREGSDAEIAQSNEVLIRAQHVPPRPSSWPSFLNYRPKQTYFYNGTSVGMVRKEEFLRVHRPSMTRSSVR